MRTFVLSIFLILSGCGQFPMSGRTFEEEMAQDDTRFFEPNKDFPVIGGDSGRNYRTRKNLLARTPASTHERQIDLADRSLTKELKELEDSQADLAKQEYQLYSHKFKTTSEKIYFLKLPYGERRIYLESRGFTVETRSSADNRPSLQDTTSELLALGMSKSQVLRGLGRPLRVEVAGNPSNENERWAYYMNDATKYVYFESGLVGGWE